MRATRLLGGLFAVAPFGLLAAVGGPQPPQKLDYEHDVKPILNAHCSKCHFADQKQGALSLETSQGLFQGGGSGKIVSPGRSATSRLLIRLLGQGGMPRMPMGFGSLNDKDIATIRKWIDEGCVVSAPGSHAHWAYIKPVRPQIPKVSNPNWVRNPIDAFVMLHLDKAGLKPSQEADRTTLIRRVTLDLTGLPPTPQEVDAFLADRSPNAYDKVVDRLFASPHYGERMALPWLDAARYADSNGFQQDGDNYQYVWRDWVVRALNGNMPFDRFTTLQLAGDLLPTAGISESAIRDQLVASGFNRNHMLNNEGGAIPEEQRNVGLFDRVDTTSTTWLGLTMTCARCHDHKYDPLSQRDYYSLMAFFNNVPETGMPTDTIGGYYIAKPWVFAGSDAEMAKQKMLNAGLAGARRAVDEDEKSGDFVNAEKTWEKAVFPLQKTEALPGSSISTHKTAIPPEILAILQTDPAQRKPEGAAKLRDYFIESVRQGKSKELLDHRNQTQKQLDGLDNQLPRVMVMSDAQPRKTHILSRGNYEAPLDNVTACTPASLPPMPSGAPHNRLGLAEWIMSPENPLTARVQVNRYWQIFFGKGLVKTPENFGVQSEPPANPELLDWLAVEFRENRWNVKRLQRLIVTSATYRQSSKVSPQLLKLDQDNRLLARAGRFRLPSLLIRDDALAASGLLNPEMGGKPVYPYQPKSIWDGLNITDERDFGYPQSKGPDLYRRSIYTFWRRTIAPGDMFDASSRQICTVRISQTSTPLHALITMNDVAWVEAGRALADRVIASARLEPGARLTEAFRRVCARRPDPQELHILIRMLDKSLQAFTADPASAAAFLKQGDTPRNTKVDPAVEAAYANVCLGILNLDEALTRE